MRSMPGTGRRSRGFTLIELMVVLAVGMILSLAIFVMMAQFEGKRRTLVSTADLDQAGSVAMYQIDGWLRSAGAGFEQSAAYAFGCALYAAKASTQILPAATLSAPFDGVNPGTSGVFRLAPVLILPGQTTPGASNTTSAAASTPNTSDVLVLMSSATPLAGMPTMFSAPAGAQTLTLDNTVAFTASKADEARNASNSNVISPPSGRSAAGLAAIAKAAAMSIAGAA